MRTSQNPQVFISYAHDDREKILKLYEDLKVRGVNVWLDEKDLKPGELWKKAIQNQIPKSKFFLFCVSESALRKTENGEGFVDTELQQAYELAQEQSTKEFIIIPVRLEDTGYGDHRISTRHQVKLFSDWDTEVDKLAVYMGGKSLETGEEGEEITADEALLDSFQGKADTAYYAGDYKKALPFYEVLVSMRPGDEEAWLMKGNTLGELRRNKEALESFERAIDINSEYFPPWHGKGNTLIELSSNEDALRSYEKAIELKPDFYPSWNGKGNALRNLRRERESLESYERAIELKPDFYHSWNGKGNTLSNLDRNKEALESYEKAIRLRPDYAYAWSGKGSVLLKLNRNKEALHSFEKAIEYQPELHIAWNGKGSAFWDMGRDEEAMTSFEKALECIDLAIHREGVNYLWYQKGRILNILGRPSKALLALEEAKIYNKDDSDVFNGIGFTLIALGRLDEAIHALNEALIFRSEYAIPLYNKGIVYKKMGHKIKAEKFFKRARRSNKNIDEEMKKWVALLQ